MMSATLGTNSNLNEISLQANGSALAIFLCCGGFNAKAHSAGIVFSIQFVGGPTASQWPDGLYLERECSTWRARPNRGRSFPKLAVSGRQTRRGFAKLDPHRRRISESHRGSDRHRLPRHS